MQPRPDNDLLPLRSDEDRSIFLSSQDTSSPPTSVSPIPALHLKDPSTPLQHSSRARPTLSTLSIACIRDPIHLRQIDPQPHVQVGSSFKDLLFSDCVLEDEDRDVVMDDLEGAPGVVGVADLVDEFGSTSCIRRGRDQRWG
ncbi:hypothetical protein MRB53_028234 [Persea americana]|uniref:Uncharacterized protein n=1 Tax=Persea americana TaxID=3435 RepID=A0ACC2KFG1_PERAE|nr:hypothetical protein MRB53_028234 [Persea americana]